MAAVPAVARVFRGRMVHLPDRGTAFFAARRCLGRHRGGILRRLSFLFFPVSNGQPLDTDLVVVRYGLGWRFRYCPALVGGGYFARALFRRVDEVDTSPACRVGDRVFGICSRRWQKIRQALALFL